MISCGLQYQYAQNMTSLGILIATINADIDADKKCKRGEAVSLVKKTLSL
jgi:hypothetical protein